MCRAPGILVTAPLEASKEHDHAAHREKTANIVNLFGDFSAGKASRVRSRRREVKE